MHRIFAHLGSGSIRKFLIGLSQASWHIQLAHSSFMGCLELCVYLWALVIMMDPRDGDECGIRVRIMFCMSKLSIMQKGGTESDFLS